MQDGGDVFMEGSVFVGQREGPEESCWKRSVHLQGPLVEESCENLQP